MAVAPVLGMSLTPAQSRACRAWLDWDQSLLASMAGIGVSTVRDFERGKRKPNANSLSAMTRAFARYGVVLLFDDKGKAIGIMEQKQPL